MALEKSEDGTVQAIGISIFIGAVLAGGAVLAIRPPWSHSPSLFAATTALGGAIGVGVFFLTRKRWSLVRHPSPSLRVAFTAMVLVYVAATALDVHSASSDELLNASLLAAGLVLCLSWNDRHYIAAAAGLALIVIASLCVVISKNPFAIPFGMAGAMAAWIQLRLIVRGESD